MSLTTKDALLERMVTATESLKTDVPAVLDKRLTVFEGAGFHNSVFRGKALGSAVTDAQYDAIDSGTFDDLYVGDYWTINDGIGERNYRIAGFDYWLNCGDDGHITTKHHAVIVPDSTIVAAKMNNSNITSGAYTGSDFYTGNNSNTGRSSAISAVNTAFGSSHILSHHEYFANAVTSGRESGSEWIYSTVDLMNEHMVYGGKVFESANDGTSVPSVFTIDKGQLPLFAFCPSLICIRSDWWLRSVTSASSFAFVSKRGFAGYGNASYNLGIRPAFGICKSN